MHLSTGRGRMDGMLAPSPPGNRTPNTTARPVATLDAEPVAADALDAASVKAVIAGVRPDAVINELTSLPRHYTPAEMRAAAERDRKTSR